MHIGVTFLQPTISTASMLFNQPRSKSLHTCNGRIQLFRYVNEYACVADEYTLVNSLLDPQAMLMLTE